MDGFPIINELEVEGDIAHDVADSGKPIKIGAKAADYEPDTEDEQGRAEVADGDRVDVATNRRGEVIEGINSKFHLFNGAFPNTGLDGRYDNSPTNSTSEAVECWNYRYATFGFSLDSTSTPTDIEFQVQIMADGINWMDLTNGPLGAWIYDDVSSAIQIHESFTFPNCAHSIRVKVTATGTTTTRFFDVDNSFIMLRN